MSMCMYFFGDDMTQKKLTNLSSLRYTIQGHPVYSQCCTPITLLWFQNTFIIPQGSSGPMEQSLFPTPFPLQPLTRFLSLVGLPILHRGKYLDADECFIYMESR